MATITKEQLKEIIQKAPKGTTPEGIVSALRSQGHQLEGYPNPQQETEAMRRAAQGETKKNVLQKVGDFLGISKFGEGIGVAANNLTGGLKPLEDAQKRLLTESDTLLAKYKEARTKGDKTTADKYMRLMKDNADALDVIAKQFTEVGTGGLSNKEVLGSAALTLGNIALAGAGAQGKAVQGSLGVGAGQAVKSAVPAITSPLVKMQE